ncbi:MAG: hypothetical protein LBG60_03060 [Bifidobacteriaceae bacterium]|nr:hypothetical protein [Bifidobacteriaceae bacterium]
MSCTPFEGGVVTPAATGASPSGSASAAAGLPYSQSWTPSPVELPFERYFAAADAAFEALDTSGGVDSRERENRIEEFKASCMKERGFTYYPVPAAEPAPDAGLGDVGHDALWSIPFLPDTLEEVERVGYGITRPLEGSATPEASAAEQQNQAYREGLTSSAQREYDLALYGYYDQASYADQGTVADACGSLAAEAFPGYSAPSGDSFERWYALTEPLDGIAEAFTITAWNDRAGVAHEDIGPYAAEADPRMADLQAEYSKCVRALAVGWELFFHIDGLYISASTLSDFCQSARAASTIDFSFSVVSPS